MPILQKDIKSTFTPMKISVIAIIGLIIIASITLSIVVLSYANVYPNVSLCGTPLGGMTKEQVTAKVTESFENSSSGKKINLVYQNEVFDLDIPSNFSVDVDATVDKALKVGRNSNIFKNITDFFAKNNITFNITQDDALINSKITSFAERIESANNIFELSPKLDVVKIDLTKNAVIVDVDATHLDVLHNIENASFSPVSVVTRSNFTADDANLIYKRIQRDPVNASCTIVNNSPVVEPHKVGISIDKDLLAQHLSKGEKIFELPITTIMPKITTDQFQSKMFADVLGEKTTTYNSSLTERTQNVTLAAKAINGVIIAPGKDFSFNQVVGERTYARGFMDATVFVNGRTEQGAGGGICQVSSTLYTTQLYADLQTIKRANHQFTVTYMPSGQDATVAYGVQDYVFRNNTAYPIKVVSTIGGGTLNIKILGTKADKDVKITIVNNTISTKSFEERTEVSSDLPAGKTVVKQKGQDGATVDTYKVYWRNGVEEKRVFLHRSVYNPMERLIQVSGAQGTQTTHETTPQPTTQPTETLAPENTPQPATSPVPTIQPTVTATPKPTSTTVPTSDTGI